MIPDIEPLVGAYLRNGLGVRVVATPPADHSTAWIRYVLLDAPGDGTKADHLIAAYLDLHVYAGSGNERSEASELARRARELLKDITSGSTEGCTFTGSRIEGFRRLPDEDLEPDRERYVVTATIYLHA